jgi:hypothetical protein
MPDMPQGRKYFIPLTSGKYTCPNCRLKTCSLACVNSHKRANNCDGRYNYQKFIPLQTYSEKDLKKDMFFLDEMLIGQERVKKKISVLGKAKNNLRFKLLRVFSKRKCHVNLQYAPSILKRHRENLSFYHTKTKTLYWSVEFKFLMPKGPGSGETSGKGAGL